MPVSLFDCGVPVRVEVLGPKGAVGSGRVRSAAGNCLEVACNRAVDLGALVRLDGKERVVLGQVVAIDRAEPDPVLTVAVEHFLFLENLPDWLREGQGLQTLSAGAGL